MNITYTKEISSPNQFFRKFWWLACLVIGILFTLMLSKWIDSANSQTSDSYLLGDKSTRAGDLYVAQQRLDYVARDNFAVGGLFEGFSPEQEIQEKRNQNSKHFRNADGTFTAQIGRNVHYMDAKGTWQNIDLTIASGATQAGYSFQNVTNEIKSYFPVHPGVKGVIMKLQNGEDFTWWNSPVLRYTQHNLILKAMIPSASRGVAIGEKLIYPEIYKNISEEFIMLGNGMESNTIIHSLSPEISQLASTAMLEFEHFLPLDKGWEVIVDGSVKTKDFSASQLFIRIPGIENGINFGRIVVFDNSISKEEAMLINMPAEKLIVDQKEKLQKSVYAVDYKVIFVDGGIKIITQLPASWLQTSTRSFPVTIDPTVTISPSGASSTFYGPLTHWYGYQRTANLYLQSEIGGFGTITKIEYNSTNAGTAGSIPTKVYFKTSTATVLSGDDAWNSTTYTGDATLCLDANTDQGNTIGWKELLLTVPFVYDQGNLMIMVSDTWGGSGAAKYYNISNSLIQRQAFSRQDGTNPGDGTSMNVENYFPETRITYSGLQTCSGQPVVGKITASVTSTCSGIPFLLDLPGDASAAGISFQWQSSANEGVDWANLGAAQASPSYTTNQTQAMQYRLVATCTNSGLSTTSNVVSVAQNPFSTCYHGPIIPFNCTDGDVIKNVTFAGIDNNSQCGNSATGYTDYSTSITPAQVRQGTTVPISVLVGPSGEGWLYESVGVWIDFNQDGILDSLGNEFTYVGTGLNEVISGSIIIPADAKLGTTRMRVVVSAQIDGKGLNRFTDGPLDTNNPFGEMEDYAITILSNIKNIKEVAAIPAITVEYPTLFADLTLPTAVEITYEDDSKEQMPLTWNGANYTDEIGAYTLTGTLNLPAHASNLLGLTASLIVNVVDTTLPTVLSRNLIIALDASGHATITPQMIDNGSTDAGGIATIELDKLLFGNADIGINTVKLTVTDQSGNEAFANATLVVVAFDDASFVYNGTPKTLTLTGQLPSGVTVSYSNANLTDVGQQTVTANINGGANYNNLTLTAQLEITKAEIIDVTFNDQTFVYSGTSQSLGLTGNLPVGASATYSNNSKTDVGTYTVTANIDGGKNYKDLVFTAQLEITKANIAGVTFNNQSFVYNGTSQSLGLTGNLPMGANAAYTNNNKTDVGTYTVTANIDGGENYKDLVLTAELEITKANITGVTFSNQTFVYNGTSQSLGLTGNLALGASATYSNNNKIDAGTYTVTANIDGGKNYNNLTLTAQLEISKAEFKGLAFENKTVIYDRTVQRLILNNSPQGSLISYTGNDQTDAGIYSVTAKVSHPNYVEKTITAILMIGKAKQHIDFDEIGTVTRDANRVAMQVSASSDLPVTVNGDDALVATVDGNDLLIHRLGTVHLTATQAGDKNHEAAAPVSIIVHVADEDEGPIRVHQALSPNGDGINDFLIIEGIKDFEENRLQIVTRNGLVVFKMEGYDNNSKVFKGMGNTNVSGGTLIEGTYFYILEFKENGKWKVKKGWFVLKN